MATRSKAAPRTSGRAAAAPVPRGSRIPRPSLVLWLVRALFIGMLTLFFASPTILTWSREHSPPTTPAGQSSGLLSSLLKERRQDAGDTEDASDTEQPSRLTPLIAQAAISMLQPRLVAALGKLGIVGVLLMLGEALLAVWGMRQQRRNLPRVPITYLLVRATLPASGATSGRVAGASFPSGDQFFRAIQQAIPRGTFRQHLCGRAPWVTFTLTGIPDRPIELGLVVADPNDKRRAETAQAIAAIIAGQLMGAQVDAVPDPLLAELKPGVVVGWREYGLRLPPHYPLRFLGDIEGSDLLGPLASAVAPRGTLRTEAQIILRAADTWTLNAGWRGNATALLLQLQAKADYALAEDTKNIEAKLDAAPFEATIRFVALAAAGEQAAGQITLTLNGIGEVLGQYHQRTSHLLQTLEPRASGQAHIHSSDASLPFHSRAPGFSPPPEFLLPWRPWRGPEILTSIEIAGLWHLPAPGLGMHVRWLPCKIIAPPPHAFILPERTDRIMIGRAKHADGTIGPVGSTLRDMRQPMHITAGMGGGKTRLLANMCRQCLRYGMFLLDGKGDDESGSLVETVRTYLSLDDEQRLIVFDILDTEWPIGLNPLAGIDLGKPGAKDQALGQIMAIFARLDPATWGKAPAMKEFLQMASLLVLECEQRPTLAHVKQCLLDEGYRETLIPYCINPDVLTFWTVTFPAQGEQQRTSLHALLPRFSQLLTTETTRYMVSQPSSRLNLLDAIEEGKIILVPLPHVTLGDIASAAGMLILQQFVRAAFSRPGNDQSRSTYPLFVDELQIFISEEGDGSDIQNAITQLRGLGIAGIYAHQTLKQLGKIVDEMLTNSGMRVIIRTQDPDASVYARLYAGSGVSAIDIEGQDENEHQYAVLRCDGKRTGLFSMQVLPWPEPLAVPVEQDAGGNWQRLIPPASPDPGFDRQLLRIIYDPPARVSEVVADMAEYDDELWAQVLERWAALRDYQRAYIIAHPGCIAQDTTITDPDPAVQAAKQAARQRLDRQMWLSRLLVATPRMLAAAEYARIRRAIEPADGTNAGTRQAGRGGRRHADRGQPILVQNAQGEMTVTAPTPTQPHQEPLVPLGFVSGATPAPGTSVAVPQISDAATFDEVMSGRGRRRAQRDVASGFEDLDQPIIHEEE